MRRPFYRCVLHLGRRNAASGLQTSQATQVSTRNLRAAVATNSPLRRCVGSLMGSVRFLGASSSVEYRSLLKLNKRTMLGAMNAFCLTRMVVGRWTTAAHKPLPKRWRIQRGYGDSSKRLCAVKPETRAKTFRHFRLTEIDSTSTQIFCAASETTRSQRKVHELSLLRLPPTRASNISSTLATSVSVARRLPNYNFAAPRSLSTNKIGDEGAKAIAGALRGNESLRQLE